ncbi:MAG TPA: GNVR domain-containing protein [Terriglobales bacterium]|jgi:capsule polysaccharide export protein KpsE/RkpR|nr:GNVR domain-containing protein [Terriglobales bacterium]
MNARKSGELELENTTKEDPLHHLEELSDIEFSRVREDHELESSRLGQGWSSYAWLLWNNRSVFSKVVLRTIIAATILVLLIPSRYESTTNIMPPEQSNSGALLSLLGRGAGGGGGSEGGGGSASPSLAALAGNLLGGGSSGALYVQLIGSRTVEDHVIDRFSLQKVYRARYKQDARKMLEARTAVDQDRKSGVISLGVTDTSPDRARQMAQSYVDELDKLLSQVSTSSARRERIFIEQRLVTVKKDLDDADKEFSAFASTNSTLDIKEQAKAELQAAAVLQGQLIAAQSELQGLEQVYTGNNVRVRSLRARIAELERQLGKISGSDASLAPDAEADPSSPDLYPSIRKLPLLGVKWAELYRRAKIQETVYQLLTQQFELTKMQEAKEIPTIRVIDPANLPEKKSWPPRLLIILALTTIALFGTAIWIIGSRHWESVDHRNSGKMLATNIFEKSRESLLNLAVRLHLPWVRRPLQRNGDN